MNIFAFFFVYPLFLNNSARFSMNYLTFMIASWFLMLSCSPWTLPRTHTHTRIHCRLKSCPPPQNCLAMVMGSSSTFFTCHKCARTKCIYVYIYFCHVLACQTQSSILYGLSLPWDCVRGCGHRRSFRLIFFFLSLSLNHSRKHTFQQKASLYNFNFDWWFFFLSKMEKENKNTHTGTHIHAATTETSFKSTV